jgi:hypothetical protein
MWLYIAAIVWVIGFAVSVWVGVWANRAGCDCRVVVMDEQRRISHGIPRASKRDMGFFIAWLFFMWPWFLIPAGWRWMKDRKKGETDG